MTQGRWTTLVVLLLAALLLAGCGGGGDDGVKQDLETQLEALMAERDAAKATQQTAEAARAAAEEARATADAARKAADEARATAETERDAAQAAQLEAEAAEAEALAAQAEAVAAQTGAEAAQTAAEAARDAAVKAKTAAETARDESRDGETQAKIDLIAAQSAQAQAERERDKADAAKAEAEQAQAAAETARQEAEAARAAAETARNAANTAKAAAEAKLAEALQSKTTTEADLATVRQQLAVANTSLATANANLQTATQNLATANAELTRVKADLEETNDKLDDAREARRQAGLAQVRAEAALAEARRQRDQAEEDTQDAQQEVQRVTQQVDVNARGRRLLMALQAALDSTTWKDPEYAAMVRINERNTGIELTASPLKGSTRKSGNLYTATLTRTAPGVNQPEHKVVAYTDREVSRSFANHYGGFISDDVGGTKTKPRFVNNAWTGDLLAKPSIISRVSRGGHDATIGSEASNPDPEVVPTLAAYVHGVSGRYGCTASDGTACEVSVAATYQQETGAAMNARKQLKTLTIMVTDGTLYFEPGNARSTSQISLLDVRKTGVPAQEDGQYITFGWWQERPGLVDGTYEAAVFANLFPSPGGEFLISDATGKAEYEGPAVGLYVDITSKDGKTNHEPGEFTATAILRATFGSGTDAGIEGDVTSFKTTHGNKNWHVRLLKTADDDNNTAEIVQTGFAGTGSWTSQFLARHDDFDASDDQPIAVTGRFDVSNPVRHIVGAFGAHRTTDPIGQ